MGFAGNPAAVGCTFVLDVFFLILLERMDTRSGFCLVGSYQQIWKYCFVMIHVLNGSRARCADCLFHAPFLIVDRSHPHTEQLLAKFDKVKGYIVQVKVNISGQ